MPSAPDTSTTLLRDLAADSQHVRWEEFVRRYRPMMEAFLGSRYPQVDADDVIQETLVTLVDKLKKFVYDRDGNRHFHNYLCGILKFKAIALIKREVAENRRRKRLLSDSFAPANYSPEKDTRWVQSAYEVALANLLSDTSIRERTRQIFEHVAVHGEDPQVVADLFGTTRNNVDQIKNRLTERLVDLARNLSHVN